MTHISEISVGILVKQAHAGVKLINDQYPEAAAILREAITRFDVLREVHQLAKQESQPVSEPCKLNGWISVDEKMPEDGDAVLVHQDGGIIFCAEAEHGWFYPDEFPNLPKQGREITHWMTLPAAPAQDSKSASTELPNHSNLSTNSPVIPDGWKLVPIEPTENMIIEGFESEPVKTFTKPEAWEEYAAMSGCKQAAHRAKLCWAAMLSAAPVVEGSKA